MGIDMAYINNQRGITLFFVFIFMITTALIVNAFLFLVHTNTKASGVKLRDNQALNYAEAGINKAIWNLKTPISGGGMGSAWRTDTYTDPADTGGVTENIQAGNYTMWVQDSVPNILITSRGISGDSRRILQRSVTASVPTDFALFWDNSGSNALTLRGTLNIDGNVYFNGNVSGGTLNVTSGKVYCTGTITSGGSYTLGATLAPLPAMPTYDSTALDALIVVYNTEIANAVGSAQGNTTYNNNVVLPFANQYFDGWVLFSGNNRTLTGNGNVVATDYIRVRQRRTIDPDPGGSFLFLAGNEINIDSTNATIVEDTTLYSQTTRTRIDQGAVSDTMILSSTIILVQGGATIDNSADTSRVLYVPAGGDVQIQDNATIIQSNIISRNRFTFDRGTITGMIYTQQADIDRGTINGRVVTDSIFNNFLGVNGGTITINYPVGMGGMTIVNNSFREL